MKRSKKTTVDATISEQIKTVIDFFSPFFKNMGWEIITLMVLVTIIGASQLFMTWAKGSLVDQVISHERELVVFLLFGILIYFVVVGFARNKIRYELSTRLQDRMGQWKLSNLHEVLKCKVQCYAELGSSQILERLNLNILRNFVGSLPSIVTESVTGTVGLVFLSIKVPYVIPFTVLYIFLYFVFCNKYGKRAAVIDHRHSDWSSIDGQASKDAVIRFEDIHLQGTEDSVLGKVDITRIWNLKARINECKLSWSFNNQITVLSSVYSIIVYVIATWLALIGEISAGDLLVVISLNNDIIGMTETIEWAFSEQLPKLSVYVNRVKEMLGYGKQEYGTVADEGAGPIWLTIQNIFFSFKEAGKVIKDVLKGITMHLSEGKVYAVVGPSGAGKSTLAKLICRLLEAEAGNIRVNGIKIQNFTRKKLTELVGMVSQKSLVFMGSIVDQFRYLPNFTWEKMEEVCKLVGLYDFVKSHPDGFLAKIGENGIKLSGGQLQRLAIAIVLLQDPKILIMDEATSAQDSETQALIYKNLEDSGFFKNKILIKIAHRLSTVCHSDKIFVLGNDGKFVGEGTHESLIHSCEYYRNLVAFEKGDL